MHFTRLEFEQHLKTDLRTAWDFFSSPFNLSRITPPEMKFRITNNIGPEEKMYPGILISYDVYPLFGIKMKWLTEITHVRDLQYFVDEQRVGPYKLWHHQHHFHETPEGVLMKDILTYSVPFGPLGTLADKLIVRKKVEDIFSYRRKAVEDLF
jgi:ligand-binding SRPBCC domain-containing protein